MRMLLRFLCCALLLSLPTIAQQASMRMPAPNPPNVRLTQSTATVAVPQQTIRHSKTNTTQSPAQSQYSHGDPTAQEQLLLEYINRARMNPSAEGDSLFNTKDADVVNNYTYWKVDKAKVRSDFKTYPARPPLAFHPKAIDAARAHSADMRDNKFQSHTGSNGSDPGQRMSKAGYVTAGWGENIFAYAHSMWEAECGFLVDWGTGNEGLGHRHNTMNFAASDQIWSEIGIGVYAGTTPVGPWVVTEDYGKGTQSYILGVVYKDKNNNKMYDIGEGISGVKITPSQGSYYAVSSTSGGYALPMGSVTGNVSVSAVGQGISEVKQVNLSNANVKLDFGQATTPGVILVFPEDNAGLDVDTTQMRWMKVTNAAKYHIQVSRDPDFSTLLKNDSTLLSKDTVNILRGLEPDSTYFWRVRAFVTTLGWGDFSPAYQFTVTIFPSVVQLIQPAPQAKLANKNITFKWSQSKPGVTKYWFEITRDTSFMDLAIQDYEITDTTWTLIDSTGEIHSDTVYYWHVAAFHNSNIYSAFSELRWFMITSGPNAVNEDEPIVVRTLAPNPVAGSMLVRYTAQQAGEVTCSIYDERGRRLADVLNERVEAGDNSFVLDFSQSDLSSLTNGTYFMRFTTAGHSFVRTLVLTR